jgi:phage baseplate assembly protein W
MPERFTAIRYPVAIDAVLGRLASEPSFEAHVVQLIKQVLLTAPGERINRPDFGCGVRRMVFAPNSDATASLLQVSVRQALDRWLGSVIETENVTVQAIDAQLEVQVTYVIRARRVRRYLNLKV